MRNDFKLGQPPLYRSDGNWNS